MTSLFCLLIILLQSVIFFYLLELPLSLWNVHPAVAGVGAVLLLFAQIKLSFPVFNMFFRVKLEEESEEDSAYRNKKEDEIGSFLNLNGVKCDTILFRDSHPVIFSFGSLWGEKAVVVSTGLLDLLNQDELEILLKREVFLLKRGDVGFFSAASFLPFVILGASFWMTDAAKESRIRKGSGASFLAGGILFYVYRMAAFFLMPLSKKRQQAADESVVTDKKGSEILRGIIEKTGSAFCLPVRSGPPFRKKIYTAMHLLMPFDPIRMQDLMVWNLYAGSDAHIKSLAELDAVLTADNPFYKSENMFSSHQPLHLRGVRQKENKLPKGVGLKIPPDPEVLRYEMFLGCLPAFFFAEGVIISMCLSGLFGIPLIFLGIMIIIRIVGESMKIRKAEDEWRDMNKVAAQGKVEAQYMENIIEAPWFFLNNGKNPIPLVLRQILRNDDSLLDFATDEVKVDGIFKTRNIPYIDIIKITRTTGKPKSAAGGYYGLMLTTGLCLILAGILMIAIEVATVR